MIRTIAVAILVFFIMLQFSHVDAQQQRPSSSQKLKSPQQTGEIKGMLVQQSTSKPAVDVELHLFGYGGTEKGEISIVAIRINNQFPPKAVSDTSGGFVFTHLPAGRYVISYAVGNIATDNYLTIQQGAISTPVIEIKKGQSIDLGKVFVRNK